MDYSSRPTLMARLPSTRQAMLLVSAALSMVLLTATLKADSTLDGTKRNVVTQAPMNDPPLVSPAPEKDTFEPNSNGVCTGKRWPAGVPPIYVITPTYPRAEQIPELTRTGQTLLHVNALVWIVAEDASKPTPAVQKYLASSEHCFVYLRVQMPKKYASLKTKPRGVANRNAGLKWIRDHAKKGGIFYFADDDNTYDKRLFEEIRKTKRVSMFPVGLVTSLGVSSPIIRNGVVSGYYDGWISNRKFPVDMAGFAVNVDYFLKYPNAVMPYRAGREETKFLEQLDITNKDIEPLADNCQKILVWHTRTTKNAPPMPVPKEMNVVDSNIQILRGQLWSGKR